MPPPSPSASATRPTRRYGRRSCTPAGETGACPSFPPFQAHHTDGLIGPWPQTADTHRTRSVLHNPIAPPDALGCTRPTKRFPLASEDHRRAVVPSMRPRASGKRGGDRMNWQRIAAAVASTLVLSACAVTTSSGEAVTTSSGEVKTESRQVSGFTVVELQGLGDLTIEQTGAESLTIEAEDDILPKLTSDVSEGTLRLGIKPNTSLRTTSPIKYRLTVKDLTGVSISGSGSASASKVTTSMLAARIRGSGTITIGGTADAQEIIISGSGKYRAAELASNTATATISGSGDAEVMVADQLRVNGSGPYFYLPKMESHLEARLWNDVFTFAQQRLGIPTGTIRATVLIETFPAAFEMEEILYELREHASGLNAGRWDYLFSIIKCFRDAGAAYVLPDRNSVTMTAPMMRAYTELLVRTCHKRGAFAIGGMAAFIPSRRDPQINERALAKVTEDKKREAGDGFDGSWVAHPDLVPVCREVFDGVLGERPNQLARLREDARVSADQLLDVAATPGETTEAGAAE
jgi:Malate synthase/Putative auto-transporter adhesin, head GIN domain